MKQHLYRNVTGFAFSTALLTLVLALFLAGCSGDNPVDSDRPELIVWPQTVNVSSFYQGSNPYSAVIRVDCSPQEDKTFSFQEDCSWISLVRPDGAFEATTLDSFSIRFDIFELPVGVHTDSVLITASGVDNSPQYVEVTLTIGPHMSVLPTSLYFESTSENVTPAPATLTIASTNGGSYPFTLESDADWLLLSHTSGQTPASIEVSVDVSLADFGLQHGIITIDSDVFLNGPLTLHCYLSLPPWSVQSSSVPFPLEDVAFADELSGWAVGYNPDFDFWQGFVLGTVDGGVTWEMIYEIETQTDEYHGLSAIASQGDHVWVVGQNGIIRHSDDRGENWEPQSTGLVDTTVQLNDVFFTSATEGWIVGDGGLILHTVDGGATWNEQTSPTSLYLTCVHFVDQLHGWAAGGGIPILRTTDGGVSWTGVNTGLTANDFRGIFFVDANTGWVVGKLGAILFTSDGGMTWSQQESNFSDWLSSVYFVDNLTGWIVGDEGIILMTEDGGDTWSEQDSPTSKWLYSVTFVGPDYGWAVGENGAIISTMWGDY